MPRVERRGRRGPPDQRRAPVAAACSPGPAPSIIGRPARPTLTRNGAHPVPPFKVYVVQGRNERDYADCERALDRVPATMTSLSSIDDEDTLIERARDADGLVVAAAPITRRVMSALEGLKVVVRTGVGYDVIDVPAASDLGVVVVNIPDLWVREVANHALALLLAWNRRIPALDRQMRAKGWAPV